MYFDTSIVTQSNTDTIADIATLRLREPFITDNLQGGGVITNASTLQIADAPTEGVSNYAILIDSGNIRLVSGYVARDVQTVTVDAATTFSVTSDHIVLQCTGAESIDTITGGEEGMRLFIEHTDTDCTINDDDIVTAADAIDLTGTATNDVGAAKKIIVLVYSSSGDWMQVSESDN